MLGLMVVGTTRAKADIILGNIPPTDTPPIYNTNGQVNTGLGLDYAVEFTASATETVSTVELVLTVLGGTTPTVAIDNATAGGALGSLVGSFTDSGLTTGTAVTETFTGSAALTGGQTYFLVVDGNNYFNWSATFSAANVSGLVPTGPGAAYLAAGSSGTYAAGNTKPSFELDAAAVPEPSTLALGGIMGATSLLGAWFRRKQTAP